MPDVTRQVTTPESKDSAVRRLRRLTVGTASVAFAAVGLFAVIAATTIPGRSDASPQAGSNSTDGSTDTTGSSSAATQGISSTADQGLQQAASLPQSIRSTSGSAHAVSGAS